MSDPFRILQINIFFAVTEYSLDRQMLVLKSLAFCEMEEPIEQYLSKILRGSAMHLFDSVDYKK